MQPIASSGLLRGVGALAGDPQIVSVVTDSRAVVPGSVFVCIKGERVDGHSFARGALAAGAAGVLAQHPIEGVPPARCVLVEDPLDALIQMGANYRELFSPLLV